MGNDLECSTSIPPPSSLPRSTASPRPPPRRTGTPCPGCTQSRNTHLPGRNHTRAIERNGDDAGTDRRSMPRAYQPQLFLDNGGPHSVGGSGGAPRASPLHLGIAERSVDDFGCEIEFWSPGGVPSAAVSGAMKIENVNFDFHGPARARTDCFPNVAGCSLRPSLLSWRLKAML
jgi:hypothetical protein